MLLTGCLKSLPVETPEGSGILGATPSESRLEADAEGEATTDDVTTPVVTTDTSGAPPRDASGPTMTDVAPPLPDAEAPWPAPDDVTESGDASDSALAAPEDATPLPESSSVFLAVPVDPPLGSPVPVVVKASADWSGPVSLSMNGVNHELMVHRGRGSLTTTFTEEDDVLIAQGNGSAQPVSVTVTVRPERQLTGLLGDTDLVWDAEADIRLDGVVTVPEGSQLMVTPGTRILLEANARLEIAGALSVTGPALFTRASEAAWGGLVVTPGGSASLDKAWFVGGGGDPSESFGHSNSQPVVKASLASMTLTGGGILDSPGKALGGYKSTVTVTDFLISRCDTGGELVQSSLNASQLHVLEIPDADDEATDDDNDGLYVVGALKVDDVVLGSSLTDVVFSHGEDDAIDHNDAELSVTRAWITGFRHEGIAASGGRTLTVTDAVIQGCDQGIEAGYGDPEVIVRNALITNNRVGLRFGDAYSWSDDGLLDVSHTVSVQNSEANVLNLTDTGEPKPDALVVSCSMVDDAAFDGQDGNAPGIPSWQASGCVDAAPCDDSPVGPALCD